ncbi:MAG: hypothetical protein DRJ63_03165 [Thermoprotei archaeon]|nr:MAG: hypothetical protein DRJ63_03165 [Thermoprotei archaeon]
MSFHLYAATVKNLRGVVYSGDSPNVFEEKIKWLVRRFRYRNLGYLPELAKKYPIIEKYLGKPFIRLYYPIPELKELVELLEEKLGTASKYIALSSIYVSPLVVIGEKTLSTVQEFSVDCVMTEKDMSDRDWKLHMRIADYTVLDFYKWSTEVSSKILQLYFRGEDYSTLIAERISKIRADKRRYWRISSDKGKPIIMYLDLLSRVIETDLARDLKSYLSVAPAVLAIVSAIIIA